MCCGDASSGPDADVEFFAEIRKVFEKFPETKNKYTIDSLPMEAERLGVNLETHVGVTRHEDGRIIIEFRPREELTTRRIICCSYTWDGGCRRTCPE